jgi:hypothetical protein
MNKAVLFVVVQIGLLYLYGLRNMFGKWLVNKTLQILTPLAKKILIRTEEDAQFYLVSLEQALWHHKKS